MNNKKAQVATTFTWIISFGLILFILAIFLVVTFSVSGIKSIKIVDFFTSYGNNEIGFYGEKIISSDYQSDRKLSYLLEERVYYRGGETRISDLMGYYSLTKDESLFDLMGPKIRNELDILYEECYSFCLYNDFSIKQIIGNSCNDFDYSCSNSKESILGREYLMGNYKFNQSKINYEIKIYSKNENNEEE